jgi:hypothetical protein
MIMKASTRKKIEDLKDHIDRIKLEDSDLWMGAFLNSYIRISRKLDEDDIFILNSIAKKTGYRRVILKKDIRDSKYHNRFIKTIYNTFYRLEEYNKDTKEYTLIHEKDSTIVSLHYDEENIDSYIALKGWELIDEYDSVKFRFNADECQDTFSIKKIHGESNIVKGKVFYRVAGLDYSIIEIYERFKGGVWIKV